MQILAIADKEKKNPDWKKRCEPSLFADSIILNIENTKDIIKKQLDLANEFGKIAGYQINIQ